MVKRLPAIWETQVQSLGQEDPLEKEMATHSSILVWKIPWMEEPGRLRSMGSQRVGHDWTTSLSLALVRVFTSLPACRAVDTSGKPFATSKNVSTCFRVSLWHGAKFPTTPGPIWELLPQHSDGTVNIFQKEKKKYNNIKCSFSRHKTIIPQEECPHS